MNMNVIPIGTCIGLPSAVDLNESCRCPHLFIRVPTMMTDEMAIVMTIDWMCPAEPPPYESPTTLFVTGTGHILTDIF